MLELTQSSHFGLYFLLVAGIVILPGMDMAFVMASALADGRRAGLAAVAGLVVGGLIHVAMSALGIGLLLVAAPRLFNASLVAGALYIAWIGVSLWRGASALGEVGAATASRPRPAVFGRAVATCLLNPKAYVFMLAVFPQFLRPEYGSVVAQSLVLAAITAGTQALVYGAVAVAAARVRTLLRTNAHAQQRLGQAVGALLFGAALWTLWQGWRG
jgi:threonine/homoserine/homoserine lactone efflux protein